MNGTNNTGEILRASIATLRGFETEYPMFAGYGDFLRRQGKLEVIDPEVERIENVEHM